MSTAASFRTRLNRVWAIGRRSEVAYLRFYPNPGLMVPWFGGWRLLWNAHDGWFTRRAGERKRPKYHRYANLIKGQGV